MRNPVGSRVGGRAARDAPFCPPVARVDSRVPGVMVAAFTSIWGRLIPGISGRSLIHGLGAAWTAVGRGGRVIFPGGRGLRGRRFFGDNLDARLRQAPGDAP